MTARVVRWSNGGGYCSGCEYRLGAWEQLPSGWVLNLTSRWRHDDPEDPLAPRTWHKTDRGHRSAAFRRLRGRGLAAPTYQTVSPHDLIVCPRCGERPKVGA